MSNHAVTGTPGAYGLNPPTVADLQGTIASVYGRASEGAWDRLLARAGASGTGEANARKLILAARDSADPILSLCGRAQHIRLVAYERLSAAHDVISSVR